jgi:nucleotide-binding universal stress UspA family protein
MKRVNIERILCPIDFSEFSRDALDHAVALASWYRASLTVMHVIEIRPVPIDESGAAVGSFAPLLDREKVADDVRDFARQAIGTSDIRTDVFVTFGTAARAIQVHSEQMRADLVIVATQGRSGFQRFLIGSVTERLLRAIAVPLLIVPPPVKKPETVTYDTILCPIDFSDESMRALDYGLSLAQESGARIILLHVVEGFLDEVDPEHIRNVNVLEFLRYSEEDASARLSAAVPEEARVWSHPIVRIARGRAYRQIVATAESERAGLVVMGVRGVGALNRLIFGSTTDHVIREARCPVLTLHADVALDRSEPLSTVDVGANR